MDLVRIISRLLGIGTVALALVSLSQGQVAQFDMPSTLWRESPSNTGVFRAHVARFVHFSGDVSSPQISYNGGQSITTGAITNGRLQGGSGNVYGSPVSWGGLSSENPQVIGMNSFYSWKFWYRVVGTTQWHEVNVPVPVAKVTVTIGSSTASRVFWLDDYQVKISPDGTRIPWEDTVEPYDPDEGPEKIYEDGYFLLQNLTGVDQLVKIGEEWVLLEPGMNSLPFYGETIDGMPAAADGMWLSRIEGPDGNTYWGGIYAPPLIPVGDNMAPVWRQPPGDWEIFPPGGSAQGPTIKLPSPPNGNDYIVLPPGVRPGGALPLPGGMAPGSPGLPPGVTPGSGGALPGGVISGGSGYLPPTISPGTGAGVGGGSGGSGGGGGSIGDPVIPGSGNGGGGSSGGGVRVVDGGTGGGGGSDGEGAYTPGPGLGGLGGQASTKGKEAADKIAGKLNDGLDGIAGKGDGILAGVKKFWTAPQSAFSGSDGSWLNLPLNLGIKTVTIEIPPQWISLIRAILLWGVKIWFVWAVLKLMMR